MSPVTKKMLMQKLKEVQEQNGDSDSSDSENKRFVDGVVAGSSPDPQIFGGQQKKIKMGNYHYDKETGTIIQKALNQKKTRLIITQIDEEDENLQFEEDDVIIQENRQSQKVVPPSPYGAFNDQSQPSIDLLIRKLKSLEVQQRQKAEIRPSGDSLSRGDSINSPLKVGNINIFNMPKTLFMNT